MSSKTSLPVRPGSRPPRHGFGFASLRDTVDDIARTSPARLALTVFAFVCAVFTALLSLPFATESGQAAPLADALFTAVSAVCVTGLVTVNTAEYWSGFGEAVILLGIQVGGLGVLTLASLLGLAVSRRLGLRQRLIAATETKALRLGEVGSLLRIIVLTSAAVELAIAVVLIPRFLVRGLPLAEAVWHGVFYSVSSFNNAGFVSNVEGLAQYARDPWITLPVTAGVFVGSLGFPVILVLLREWRRPAGWSIHAKLTLTVSIMLAVGGIVLVGALEWRNDATFGAMPVAAKVLSSIVMGIMPRSGGFSTVDVTQMGEGTWLVMDALMFVGGGSASTAGGVRVTTLAVLFLAVVAEARGDSDVEVFKRRIPQGTLRLAITVVLVGATVVLLASLALLAITNYTLDVVLFEVISAFATCGLSTGITSELPDEGKYIVALLMYVGRTGTMTLAGALALRERRRMFRLPEERPIVG